MVSRENTENLRKGPCRYAGSAYTNNLVIAGHNYRQHFGPIRNLSYGDVVRLVDMDGNVFRYEVVDMETIPPGGGGSHDHRRLCPSSRALRENRQITRKNGLIV